MEGGRERIGLCDGDRENGKECRGVCVCVMVIGRVERSVEIMVTNRPFQR